MANLAATVAEILRIFGLNWQLDTIPMDGNAMFRSRTIKTLTCLVVAMTAGTFLLTAMETKPATVEQIIPLTALRNPADAFGGQINQVRIPIRSDQWMNIIIHDSACSSIGSFSDDCHFIVYGKLSEQYGLDGVMRATKAWQNQSHGQHTDVPGCDYNSNSISICLEGDFAASAPSKAQMATLAALVRSLQRRLNIDAERVYLHGELTGQLCPGNLLDANALRSQLLSKARR